MNNSIAILLASAILLLLSVCAMGEKPSPTSIVTAGEAATAFASTTIPVPWSRRLALYRADLAKRIQRKNTATLRGTVTYAGAVLPTPRDLTLQMQKQGDKDHCLKGDTLSQEWIISRDKGVANVVVFLKAPGGNFFQVPDNKRYRTDTITMDQPFCAFKPGVVAFNPSYYDTALQKQVKTGQTLKVTNSAPINHNVAWSSSAIFNTGKNVLLRARDGTLLIDAKPCRDHDAGKEDVLKISCDIHRWMSARVVVLDHPYYAVTDKDGKYEIKDAPANTEVDVVYWHESMGDAINKAPRQKIKLKRGENTQDFAVGK
jgi:hypothetical protein